MSKMNVLDWIAVVLLIVGGLNWGLVAFDFNLVEFLLGKFQILVRIVYGLVGLSALYAVWVFIKLSLK